MNFGAICSAGGSVILEGSKLIRKAGADLSFKIVTDRPCEAELMCEELAFDYKRIEYENSASFSRLACSWLTSTGNIELVVLFYSRVIASDLYGAIPCVNFHPSLLPSNPGLGSLKRTFLQRPDFFGATVHWVEQSVDAGPIVAQIKSPFSDVSNFSQMKRISFAQKLYLFLVVYELASRKKLIYHRNSREPEINNCLFDLKSINSHLGDLFQDFTQLNQIPWNPVWNS